MKKIKSKISNLYFVCVLILIIIVLLPKEYIYAGYSWTLLGYLFLILILFLIPITFLITIFYDIKGKRRQLFLVKLFTLIFGISIWYLRFYVWNY